MTKRQTIYKAKGLESEFLILANKDAQRKDISYEAVGMLAYLVSLPADWTIYVKELQRPGFAGRDKVRRILIELESNGYLSIHKNNAPDSERNEGGKFSANNYVAYAMPEYNPTWNPDSPATEKPSTVQPLPVNPPLQSKEVKKENTIQSSAPDKSGESKPKSKPEKKRDILFDGICALGYRIPVTNLSNEDLEQLKKTSPRIAQAKKKLIAINEDFKTMTDDAIRTEIKNFWSWLKKKMLDQYQIETLELRDANKWGEYYSEWHLTGNAGNSAAPVQYFTADDPELSEDEKNESLNILKGNKKS